MSEGGKPPEGILLDVPGWDALRLSSLLLDVNGTIARDGKLLPGVPERIQAISRRMTVYLITADTFGTVSGWKGPWTLSIIDSAKGSETDRKEEAVRSLGRRTCVAIGNGANDAGMLKTAALGICVIGREGAASLAMAAADVVIPNIEDALDLLLHPRRLQATLRR